MSVLYGLQNLANRSLVDDVLKKVNGLKPIADELGVPLSQLAIAWCASNPNVSSVITGATKESQVSIYRYITTYIFFSPRSNQETLFFSADSREHESHRRDSVADPQCARVDRGRGTDQAEAHGVLQVDSEYNCRVRGSVVPFTPLHICRNKFAFVFQEQKEKFIYISCAVFSLVFIWPLWTVLLVLGMSLCYVVFVVSLERYYEFLREQNKSVSVLICK